MSDRERAINECWGGSCTVTPDRQYNCRPNVFFTTHYPLPTIHHSLSTSRHHRRGFTLIEMVCAITVSALLMGIAVLLLASLLKSEWSGREHFERGNSLDSLADRFRRDVHAAVDAPAKLTDGREAWDMPVAIDGFSHYIRYEVDGEYITRHEHNSEHPERWETYALPKGCTVSIETETIGDERIVCLIIAAKDASPTAGRNVRIEAQLGRDHRFEHRAEEEEK